MLDLMSRLLLTVIALFGLVGGPAYAADPCPKPDATAKRIEDRIVRRCYWLGGRKFDMTVLTPQPLKTNSNEPDLKGIGIHNTGVPFTLRKGKTGREKLEGHHDSHIQANDRGIKLGGIAYHFYIDETGEVFEGRDTAYVGATYTNYDPTGLITVVLEGAFSDSVYNKKTYPADQPTEQQIASLKELLIWLCAKHGINPLSDQVGSGIHGHNEFPAKSPANSKKNTSTPPAKVSTTCPGTNLSSKLDDLRQSTRAGLAP